jgi:hypothetical protein
MPNCDPLDIIKHTYIETGKEKEGKDDDDDEDKRPNQIQENVTRKTNGDFVFEKIECVPIQCLMFNVQWEIECCQLE